MSDSVNPSEGTVLSSMDDAASLIASKRVPAKEAEEANPEAEDIEEVEDTEDLDVDDPIDGDVSEDFDDEFEEEEAAEDTQETEYYTVKVDGKELQVTLEELQSGYMKDADYRKKTAESAKEREELKAERERVADLQKLRENSVQELEILEQAINSFMLTDDQLRVIREKHGTDAYIDAKDANEKRKKQMADLRKRRDAVQTELTEEQKKQHQEYFAREQEALRSAIPEINNQEYQTKLVSYLTKDLGFSAEEIDNVGDHRLFVIADKARRYDELQSKKVRPTKKAPKVMKRKSARQDQSAIQQQELTKLTKRVQSSGKSKPEDIAALISGKRNLKGA